MASPPPPAPHLHMQSSGPPCRPLPGGGRGARVLEAVVPGSRGALEGEMSVGASFHQRKRRGVSSVGCWLRFTSPKCAAASRESGCGEFDSYGREGGREGQVLLFLQGFSTWACGCPLLGLGLPGPIHSIQSPALRLRASVSVSRLPTAAPRTPRPYQMGEDVVAYALTFRLLAAHHRAGAEPWRELSHPHPRLPAGEHPQWGWHPRWTGITRGASKGRPGLHRSPHSYAPLSCSHREILKT